MECETVVSIAVPTTIIVKVLLVLNNALYDYFDRKCDCRITRFTWLITRRIFNLKCNCRITFFTCHIVLNAHPATSRQLINVSKCNPLRLVISF